MNIRIKYKSSKYIKKFDSFEEILDYSGVIYLDCSNNQLSSLPQLPDSLQVLRCQHNNLSSLPQLPNSLEELYCNNNQLSSLPQLPNSLKKLYCENNKLSSLPQLPDSLETLYCDDNQLSNLSQLPNTLKELSCENNQLSSLPQLPNSLTYLDCRYNQFVAEAQAHDSGDFICTPRENYLQKIIYCISQHKNTFLYNLFGFFGEKCLKCNYSFINIDKYIFTKWEGTWIDEDIFDNRKIHYVVVKNSSCAVCL